MPYKKNTPIFVKYVMLLSVLWLLTPATTAFATHFRYGHISWKARPDLNVYAAEITLFASFRRDGYTGSGSDGRPVNGDIISENIGGTSLRFGDGSSFGNPIDFIVIAFDPNANWIYCKALANRSNVGLPIIHTYSNAGPWTAEINRHVATTAIITTQ